MTRPRSPYKYEVCIRGRTPLRVHQIRAGEERETLCGWADEATWLVMWITQEQLDAMPSERWCLGCMKEIEQL